MAQTPIRVPAGTLAGLGQIAEHGEPLSATLTRVVRDHSVSADLAVVDAWYATLSDEDRAAVAAFDAADLDWWPDPHGAA